MVSCGHQSEIVYAVRSIIAKHDTEGYSFEELAASLASQRTGAHFYMDGQPDPDVVVRNSREQRLGDFLLWQNAHSRFYFAEAPGPDLRGSRLLSAFRGCSSTDQGRRMPRRWRTRGSA